MTKKLLLILTLVILLTGCKSKKFYLEDKYYGNSKYLEISEREYNKIKDTSFVLFTYNSYCQFSKPCDQVFEQVMKKNNISFLAMPYAEFKKTNLHDKVTYAPSIIIVQKGKIVAYLDSESNDDLKLYQDSDKFEKWLDKYIYLKKN
ncbi:MAG: hypothetical protein IKN87_02035 [Bacilli bacterium]|nr:hypothetical protein [Bacilli bacterium]